MPTKSKRRLQAKSQQRALQKLKDAGLYSGKVDRRKNPTKYQQRLLAQYKDVVSGKAAVVKPKNPASYKSLFRVKGDKVIVPRVKGEKVKVNTRGNIVSERKNAAGQKVSRSYRRVKSSADLKPGKGPVFYFVPFIRGRDPLTLRPRLEWKRFPNKEMLQNFMEGYDYKDWTDYVIEERVDPDHPYSMDFRIEERLNKKLGNKKRKKIRFADDTGDE